MIVCVEYFKVCCVLYTVCVGVCSEFPAAYLCICAGLSTCLCQAWGSALISHDWEERHCRWKESWSGCLTTDSECYYCFRRWKQKLHLACLFQWFHFFVSELHFNDKLIWFLVFLVWSFKVSSSTESPTHRMASSRQFKVFCVLCGACFTAGGAAEFTRFSLHIKDTVKVTLTVTVVICIMFTCWLCLFVCMCWGVGVSMELLTSF